MNVVSDTSDVHILESIVFKVSSKQATTVGVKFIPTSYASSVEEQPLGEQYQPVSADPAAQIIPICFLMAWAIAILVFLRLTPHRHKQTVCAVRGQIPCMTCRFFTNNPYVKCAVRPDLALTKQAADCTDYQA
ncbi:MAG: hypothetical protein SFY66_00375 [Oculatellaceae cyanobacterium bins.114]|nr:hypothetical protein [Oculatellaceae cyanobacterium bins.114]